MPPPAGTSSKAAAFAASIRSRRIIDCEKSDLFDVLAYIAYALPTLTREERASMAKLEIDLNFDAKQQAFLNFVLAHYVAEGVHELDQEKLTPLLRLRYNNSIADALKERGRPEEIGRVSQNSTNTSTASARRTKLVFYQAALSIENST
jgi:type I restriction enzyme R subunit